MPVIVTWKAETCCECGAAFCMDNDLYLLRQKDHRMFYCPNGHAQHYIGETASEKRVKELERALMAEQQRVRQAQEAQKWAETSARGARQMRGKAEAARKRLEHRVACGVCPHCQRTFQQLARHMRTKHPEAK